jgi:hypothetical protein
MQIGFSGSKRKSAGATGIIVPLVGCSVRNFVFDPTMHLCNGKSQNFIYYPYAEPNNGYRTDSCD